MAVKGERCFKAQHVARSQSRRGKAEITHLSRFQQLIPELFSLIRGAKDLESVFAGIAGPRYQALYPGQIYLREKMIVAQLRQGRLRQGKQKSQAVGALNGKEGRFRR